MITIKRFSTSSNNIKLIMALLIFILGFIAVAPPLAQAEIPRYINYQGKLTDADDNPVTGDVSIKIRIYNAVTGGTALWTETQTVTVTRGIFSILLGNTTALTSLDFNSAYWYSVEVGSDGEMTPRQRLTAVAYAINADKLGGYGASQFLRADADTSLTGALTVSGNITGSANGDITLDPTGTGNIVMKIDSTSGDFKVTDGTTNYVLVDNATGNVTMSNDLTVSGTIYGTLASTGGNSTFSSIIVTGTSSLRGEISNSTGAVTIADALTQSGSSNQVTFAGNVDANNGLDVTGALTVSGATTLSSALDMNSNIDLDYSGTSAALDVTQASTGPAAQFSGGRVVVGASEASNAYALSTGELYVLGDLEVDGTIYGNVSSSGSTALGATTLSSLTVTGTSDLQGNISNSAGTVTVADYLSVTQTDSSTSGTVINMTIQPTYQDAGTNSTTAATALKIAPTINYTGTTKTGSYTALKIAATETSLPTSTNYLIDAYAGADGTTQKFYVDNSGNAKIFGTLDMNSQKITSLATPTATTDAATKAYVDSITPASAGGWTDGGTGVYLIESTDNVGIGTNSTGTYKLNVSGSINTTNLYIGGTQITSTAAELNKLASTSANVTAVNLGTLTGASNADSLHTHTASGISSGVVFTAPASAQTIQPTADVVPLTIKGKASAASNVLSIYDAAAVPSEKIYVDSAGHMRIAETTTGAAQASAATMYFGRNATDNWETIGYDPTLGTKGLFTFSAPLQVEASSPTGITFVEKNSQGAIIKSQGFMYDPSADEFSFTGGKMKQAFQNLVRGGSFESWNTPGWYSAWYSGAYTTTTYYKFGTKSLYIYDSSNTQTAFKAYYISNWDRLKGSSVTLSVWARCDSGTTTASVGIGTNSSNMEATTVNNIALTTTWQNFSFTYSVPTGATTLKVYLYGSEGTNGIPDSSKMSTSAVYYDGVTLAEGKLALEYGPSPVFDTGDQVIGGSLAIGADIDPYNTGSGMNYYLYPRIVFGEPDKNFGGYYDAYSYGGYYYNTYGGGAGEISFRPLNTSSGTFTFNRPIGMDSYEMSTSSWRTPALFIGRLYDYSGGSAVDKPDYAWTTSDAYIKGVVEADGGIYGDIMSFYGGVGKTSNLLTYSEDFTQGVWSKTPDGLQVSTGELAPDGTSTACRLTSAVDASVTQTVSATNSTTYTFSIYLAPGAQNYAYIFLKSNVETDWWTWPNYQYVDLYNTTGWRRFSVTYTTPSSGVTSVMAKVMFYGSSSYDSIKAWGAQLRPTAAQGIYLKTLSSSITNSNSLFHGDGSGLTNLSASSIISGTASITGITGNTLTINEDLTGAPTDNLTLAFNRGTQTDAAITWDETNDKFVINNPVNISNNSGLTVSGTITAGTGSNIITTAAGLLDATKLSGTMPALSLPADGYGSTYVNVTGDTMTGALNFAAATGNFIDAQNSSVSKFKVDTSGNTTIAGNLNAAGTIGAGMMTSAGLITAAAGINVSGGNIAITDASNIVLNTNKIIMYGATGNAVLAGALTQLRSIGLTPDYDNAALNPDGADNFGTLTLKYSNSHNYYEWTTSEPTTQDYDIVIRYRLPNGFSSFDATTPIKLWNKVSATPGATKVDVTMLDTLGASVTLTGGSTLQNTSWAESTINITDTPTFTAGGYVTITIKMSADQGKLADIGELTLKGNW